MKEFQEKNKIRRKKRSKILLLFMFLVFVFLTRGAFNAYTKERNSRFEVERTLKEKDALDKRYQVISEQSDALKSDIGVESEIRNKFDVVKDGEGVIVIVDRDVPIIEEDKRGVLKRFWDSVRGVFSPDAEQSGQNTKKIPEGR
jgi:cell division protein FtsB